MELAAIEHELNLAAQGHLSCVVVEGEPGIGKTRLLVSAQELAEKAGFAVIAATADEELRGPFLVARSILGCGTALELAEQVNATATVERTLNAMMGRDDPGIEGMPPEQRVLRTYDLAAVALRELVAARPIAILLDDLQWADEDSLRLLRYVIRADADSPILLVLALRPEETALVTELVTLTADLDRLGYLRRLRLRRFTQRESTELLERVLNGAVAPAAAAALHAQAEGVPFILEALAGAYRDAGMVQQIDGIWNLAKNAHRLLPGAVQTLIQRRVTKLPDATRTLLGEAAVVGRSFSLRDIAAIREQLDRGDVDTAALAEVASPAVAAGLLHQQAEESPADYTFSHDQIRAFALKGLSVSRRRAIHRAIVEMLSESGEPPPESLPLLVHHARESGESDLSARFALDAARTARDRNAPDEVLRVVELGLPAVAEPRDRLALLLLRDDAFGLLRRTNDRLEALAEIGALADALGDRQLQLQVLLRRAAALRSIEEYARAIETARRVREQASTIGDRRLELEACVELGQACLREPLGETFVPMLAEIDAEGAHESYSDAARLAAELGDERIRAAATRELGVVAMAYVRGALLEMEESRNVPSDLLAHEPLARPYMAALGHFQESLEIYQRIGDRHGVMSSILALAYATWGADFRMFGVVRRLESVRMLVARARALSNETERDFAELQMLYGVHAFARDFGYPDLALSRGEEAYEKARAIGERMLEFLAALGMGLTHLQFEECDAADDWLRRAAASAAEAPSPLKARLLEMARGRSAVSRGQPEAALTHLQRAVDIAFDQGRPAARCETLAQLALEGARVVAAGEYPPAIVDRIQVAAQNAIDLAGSLPGHPPWRAKAHAALAALALQQRDDSLALQSARDALTDLEPTQQEELFLDILLPCARAIMLVGDRDEREQLTSQLQFVLGGVAERILDDQIRTRWFSSGPQRELVAMIGGLDVARETFRASPLMVARQSLTAGTRPIELNAEEQRLLRLMSEGRTDEEIAGQLGRPPHEIARELAQVIGKLGAPSRAAATAFIFLQRLV